MSNSRDAKPHTPVDTMTPYLTNQQKPCIYEIINNKNLNYFSARQSYTTMKAKGSSFRELGKLDP